jgi:exonuclease III
LFIDYGPGQDKLPDVGSVVFTFSSQNPAPITPISIKRAQGNSIRLLSYNVLFDGLFDPAKVAAFNRILTAIDPEIIGFQEIYNHDAQQTAAQVEAMLPSTGQQQWYAEKAGPDNIAVSRYPIENTYIVEGNGAFVINLNPQYNSKLLFIVAHLPCCGNNTGRQYEADAIMAFIRDAKSAGGTTTLPSNTPIIIIGDLNLVGFAQQLTTLLTGDIVNIGVFGQPFSPDWDNSDFTDLTPRHTSQEQFFTWYDSGSSFGPGRLDFMIYSDSVIESKKNFVLFTPVMSSDSLLAYNLFQNDVPNASDHIPVISDFKITSLTGFDDTGQTYPKNFSLQQNYPNPFNPSTTITYEIPEKSKVKIAIYNSLGKLVKVLLNEEVQVGANSLFWDGTNQNNEKVSSGFYFIRMIAKSEATQFMDSKQILLVR